MEQLEVRATVGIMVQPAPEHRFLDPGERLRHTRDSINCTIRVNGYVGPCVIVASCVTRDSPFRPHPFNLVGHHCHHGVCRIKANITENDRIVCLKNIGIQRVKKRDVVASLLQRHNQGVDPFRTACNRNSPPIGMHEVRLAIEVFHVDAKGRTSVPLYVIASNVITKCWTRLRIGRLSPAAGTARGGTELMLFVEELLPRDRDGAVTVRFEEPLTGWSAEVRLMSVVKMCVVIIETPPYRNPDTLDPVSVEMYLQRTPAEKNANNLAEAVQQYETSNRVLFEYKPNFKRKLLVPQPAAKRAKKTLDPSLLDYEDVAPQEKILKLEAVGEIPVDSSAFDALAVDLSVFDPLAADHSTGYPHAARVVDPPPVPTVVDALAVDLSVFDPFAADHSMAYPNAARVVDPPPAVPSVVEALAVDLSVFDPFAADHSIAYPDAARVVDPPPAVPSVVEALAVDLSVFDPFAAGHSMAYPDAARAVDPPPAVPSVVEALAVNLSVFDPLAADHSMGNLHAHAADLPSTVPPVTQPPAVNTPAADPPVLDLLTGDDPFEADSRNFIHIAIMDAYLQKTYNFGPPLHRDSIEQPSSIKEPTHSLDQPLCSGHGTQMECVSENTVVRQLTPGAADEDSEAPILLPDSLDDLTQHIKLLKLDSGCLSSGGSLG